MDSLAQLILLPDRSLYSTKELGPHKFSIEGSSLQFSRLDFSFRNRKGLIVQVTLYKNNIQCKSCVVFLHSNGGCRLQGLPYLKAILLQGIQYCVLDFSGSGLSEGRYSSVGFHQSSDIDILVKQLQARDIQNIVLWGHSMGAVASMLYSLRKPGIVKGLILDSPYSDMQQVAQDLAWSQLRIPQIMVKLIMPYIQDKIQQKHQFRFENLKLGKKVAQIYLPALFMANRNDTVIKYSQVQDLLRHYGGPYQLVLLQEDHKDLRSIETIKRAIIFIKKILKNQLNEMVYSFQNEMRGIQLKEVGVVHCCSMNFR